MSRVALVAAAGEGSRLGLGPKAFLPIGERSLLRRAVDALAPHVDEVIVAVSEAMMAEAPRHAPGARVVVGGASRQDTVRRLLQASAAELVLIHDAARPFLSAAVVVAVAAAAGESGAATAVRPVADTLLDLERGRNVDREALRAVQTPQGFRRELLLAAHEAAAAAGLLATDDAELVRRRGGRVALVPGDAWLFKVTTAEDLELARALAPAWEARGER